MLRVTSVAVSSSDACCVFIRFFGHPSQQTADSMAAGEWAKITMKWLTVTNFTSSRKIGLTNIKQISTAFKITWLFFGICLLKNLPQAWFIKKWMVSRSSWTMWNSNFFGLSLYADQWANYVPCTLMSCLIFFHWVPIKLAQKREASFCARLSQWSCNSTSRTSTNKATSLWILAIVNIVQNSVNYRVNSVIVNKTIQLDGQPCI